MQTDNFESFEKLWFCFCCFSFQVVCFAAVCVKLFFNKKIICGICVYLQHMFNKNSLLCVLFF